MVASAIAVFLLATVLVLARQHLTRSPVPRCAPMAAGSSPPPLAAARQAPVPVPAAEPAAGADIEVLEYETAGEIADVLFQLGQVAAAVEVLRECIAGNPKQSVEPWLQLLEIHRAQGARKDYEQVATQLARNFNVRARPWDGPVGGSDGLEHYPHIARELVHRWGTHACHHYLLRLLAANRDGTRRGFGPEVVEEILLLAAVLEQAHLRKPAAPQCAAAAADAPATLDIAA
jgi:hypothetical protein